MDSSLAHNILCFKQVGISSHYRKWWKIIQSVSFLGAHPAKKVKAIRTDSPKEYNTWRLCSYLDRRGIQKETSVPYCQCKGRSLKARCNNMHFSWDCTRTHTADIFFVQSIRRERHHHPRCSFSRNNLSKTWTSISNFTQALTFQQVYIWTVNQTKVWSHLWLFWSKKKRKRKKKRLSEDEETEDDTPPGTLLLQSDLVIAGENIFDEDDEETNHNPEPKTTFHQFREVRE